MFDLKACALSICHKRQKKVETAAGKHRLGYDVFHTKVAQSHKDIPGRSVVFPHVGILTGSGGQSSKCRTFNVGRFGPTCLSRGDCHLRDWAMLRLLARIF